MKTFIFALGYLGSFSEILFGWSSILWISISVEPLHATLSSRYGPFLLSDWMKIGKNFWDMFRNCFECIEVESVSRKALSIVIRIAIFRNN